MKWAHEGTKESVEKLERLIARRSEWNVKAKLAHSRARRSKQGFIPRGLPRGKVRAKRAPLARLAARCIPLIESAPDDNTRVMARIALDEARFNYLCANDAQEERDLELAFLIVEKEERRSTLQEKIDVAEHDLAVLKIEKDVHDALIAGSNKARKEAWKYNYSEDHHLSIVMRRDELRDEFLYLDAWIAQARKLIKTQKYKNLPQGALDGWHHFSEGVSLWDDDDDEACPVSSCEVHNHCEDV